VCAERGWPAILGMNRKSFFSIVKQAKVGLVQISPYMRTPLAPKTSKVTAWIENYAETRCQHNPVANSSYICHIVDVGTTRKDVYNLMAKELGKVCSLNSFYQLLKSHPNLKFPSPSNMPKCDVCVDLKEKKHKAASTAERLIFEGGRRKNITKELKPAETQKGEKSP